MSLDDFVFPCSVKRIELTTLLSLPMAESIAAKTNPGDAENAVAIQVSWANRDGTVVVTPQSQDRYCMRIDEAIELLQLKHQRDRATAQFEFLFRRLSDWIQQRGDRLKETFLTFRDGQWLFLMVSGSQQYDEQFEDEVTDLDIELAGDPELNLIDTAVLSLPSAGLQSLDSFLHERLTFRLTRAED